jgi:uncharacterized caspase-like protein
MKETLRGFKAQVAGGDEVVFYFSGHGVQFGGSNYPESWFSTSATRFGLPYVAH